MVEYTFNVRKINERERVVPSYNKAIYSYDLGPP